MLGVSGGSFILSVGTVSMTRKEQVSSAENHSTGAHTDPPPQTKKVKCEEIHLPFQPNHSAVKGRQHTYTKGMEHHLKFSESLRDIMKAMTAHPFLVSQNPHWVRLATAGSFFFFEQFPVKEAGQEGS